MVSCFLTILIFSILGIHVIEKGFVISATKGIKVPSLESIKKEFDLSDPMYFAKCGVEVRITLIMLFFVAYMSYDSNMSMDMVGSYKNWIYIGPSAFLVLARQRIREKNHDVLFNVLPLSSQICL